jgi:hypothetical protein
MKAIKHSIKPLDFAWMIPQEYTLAISITKGMDFSYKINEDGSITITPKKQA